MIYAILAYLLWGAFPAFFPLLEPAAPLEILAHRFVWTLGFMVLVLTVTRHWRPLREASLRTWGWVALAGFFISGNWGIYVYTVNTGHVAEAALGYFINPIVSVALGVLFLKERLSPLQTLSVGIAFLGVLVLTITLGTPPLLALGLAFSFGFYGLIKKRVPLTSTESLTAETIVIFPIAAAYLLFLSSQGESTFTEFGWQHTALLMTAGVVTATPLLFFGKGVKEVPLAAIGMLQYMTPTMQMLWAVFVTKEDISTARWVGFIIIWASVAIFMADIALRARHRAHIKNSRRV